MDTERHQIAFSPDPSATESLYTDRSEPELRQASALSHVSEDDPKPTAPWQNNPEYNQVNTFLPKKNIVELLALSAKCCHVIWSYSVYRIPLYHSRVCYGPLI